AGRVEVLGSGKPAPHQGHHQHVHDSQSYKSSLPAPEICRQPGNEASGETAQYGACYVDSRGFHRFFLTPLFANIGNSGGKIPGMKKPTRKRQPISASMEPDRMVNMVTRPTVARLNRIIGLRPKLSDRAPAKGAVRATARVPAARLRPTSAAVALKWLISSGIKAWTG